MRSPQAVFFDLGNVLLDFDYRIAIHSLAAHTETSAPTVRQLLLESPLLERYERGELTSLQFFEQFREAARYRSGYAEFRQQFADIFTPNIAVIALHAALRHRRVPCFLLSNTNEIAITHIRRRYPFLKHFTGSVFSFEVGALKPQPRIYRAAEQLAACRGSAIFYLDDRPENVEPARRRGWQAMEHRSAAASRAALRTAGLL